MRLFTLPFAVIALLNSLLAGPQAFGEQKVRISNREVLPHGRLCPWGGIQVVQGVDLNGNDKLDPGEIDKIDNHCNAVPQPDPAYDSDCGAETDLEAPGHSMANVAVRDQIGGTCYAETAAQLADAWRFSHGDTRFMHQTSALAAAAYCTLEVGDLGGGFFDATYEAIRKNGSCDDLLSIENINRNSGDAWANLIKSLEIPYDRYQSHRADRSRIKEFWEEEVGRPLSGKIAHEVSCKLVSAGIDPTLLPGVSEIKKALEKLTVREFLGELLTSSCKPAHLLRPALPPMRTQCPLRDFENCRGSVGANLARKILERPAGLPVAISFCGRVFVEGRGYEMVPSTDSAYPDRCGNHSALIVGKRRNPATGKCQFKIRNSYGRNCFLFSEDWECVRNSAGVPTGSLWIDSDALFKTTYQIGDLGEK
jgi:hypothetical protein